MFQRTLRLVVALAMTSAAFFASAPGASAAFSDTPDPTWMTNGQVYAIAQAGNVVYLGGKFTSIRACPPGTSCPGNVVSVLRVAAMDATTGEAIRTFKPQIGAKGDGSIVYALAVIGSKLFIGGKFTSVNGAPRLNLAAVDLVTGALDPDVDAQVGVDTSDKIRGMVASSDRVYVAGYFTTVDGLARKHLAAFDVDGNLDGTWKPRADGLTRSLLMTCDGSSVIVGGDFRTAGGSGATSQARATLAIFDAASGALDPWTPDNANIPNGVNAFDLAANCDRLFVGYGGSNALYGLDLTDDFGNILFSVKTGGNVQTVALRGSRVYFGGHFSQVSVQCGSSGNENEQRIRFAVADLNGCVRNPDGSDLDGFTPSFEGNFYGPWDIHPNATQLYVGGQFSLVSGVPQYMIARFTDA
jgi:hypothetical protein